MEVTTISCKSARASNASNAISTPRNPYFIVPAFLVVVDRSRIGLGWQTAHNPKSSGIFSLIAALAFALWLGPAPALPDAIQRGLLAGFGMVAASFGINYQFANRSTTLWLVDGGYHTVQFLLFGVILGLWH